VKLYQKNLTFKQNIPYINSYLIILLGFFMPISVSIATIILAIILLLWLFEGKFLKKYKILQKNYITYAFASFFIIQVIGLLWTQDMKWGIHIVSKEWRILLPLILITIVRKEHIRYYIFSFLIAMSISELISYAIWFRIVPPFKSATIYDPTPFMSHISYSPFLAFSIFILYYILLFEKKSSNLLEKGLSVLFVITMSINIFITGGRAGQIAYFAILVLMVFIYFKKNIAKAFLIVAILIPTIFIIAYNSSKIFNDRVNLAKTNMMSFDTNKNTSVGLRLAFLFNSLEIIKKNPIFGVGTGDFPIEYKKINEKNTPNLIVPAHPHNMYLLELVQTGIFGFITLLSIFYIQIKIALKGGEFAPLKIALPVIFLIIMLSDSYLLGHYTTLLFVYFSSFLYKDYGDEDL